MRSSIFIHCPIFFTGLTLLFFAFGLQKVQITSAFTRVTEGISQIFCEKKEREIT